MTIHHGSITKIGDGAKCIFTSSTIISVIEIGNDTLRNIRVSPLMSTYLKEALGHNAYIAIYGKWLCAIRLKSGRVVIDDTVNKHLLLIVFSWGLITTPLFGIGLIFVGISIYKFIRIRQQKIMVDQLRLVPVSQ